MHNQERSSANGQAYKNGWKSWVATRWPLWVLAAVILIAATLRLWKLNALPPGLWYDEAINGVDARMVLSGMGLPAYFTANNGREPLFIYLQTLSVALFGATRYALLLVSALAGILTVPAVYFCARTFFAGDPSRQSATGGRVSLAMWAALLAAAGLAVSYWHLSLSRLGLRAVLLPLVSALAIAFFYRAWTCRRYRDWAWAGAWMAVSLYTYIAARVLPLVPLAFILVELVGDLWRIRHKGGAFWEIWRPRLQGLAVAVAVMSLVCAPLAISLWRNPNLLSTRTGAVSVFSASQETMPGTPLQRLAANVVLVARSFYDTGDLNPRHNLPGRSANDPFLAALFTVGWLTALWRFRQPQHRLLLIWLAVMLVPTLLATDAPHFLRGAGALPPLALLYGVGGQSLLQLGAKARIRRWGAPVLLALMVLISGGLTSRDYFVRWVALPKSGGLFSLEEQMAAETTARLLADPSFQGQFILLPHRLFAQPQMVFEVGLTTPAPLPASASGGATGAIRFLFEPAFDPHQPLVLVWREAGVVKSASVEPLSAKEATSLAEAIRQDPTTQVIQAPLHQAGWQTLATGPLPSAISLQPRKIAVPLDVTFANGLRLIGYDVQPDVLPSITPDGGFQLTLFWQIEPNMDPRAVAACQAFVHLVDQDAVWEQANGYLAEAFLLHWSLPGERTVQDIRMVVPPKDAPYGKAYFEAGLIGCAGGAAPDPQQRIGIVDGRGQVVADRLDLGAVMIGEQPPQADLAGLNGAKATFENRIALIGSQVVFPGLAGTLNVDLAWQALARSPSDYTAFVHLIDADENILAQYDQPPGGLANPTTRWVPGETVRATFPLEPPAGADLSGLRLRIGLYEPVSGRQLVLSAVGDSQAVRLDRRT